jgi:predicted AAA+ superfamily ATPase
LFPRSFKYLSAIKKQWMINSAIPNAARSLYYFIDHKERNVKLLEMIEKGEFIALHGPRASGKTTRMFQIQEQLQEKGFICI